MTGISAAEKTRCGVAKLAHNTTMIGVSRLAARFRLADLLSQIQSEIP